MSKLLWTPTDAGTARTNMVRFIRFVNETNRLELKDYEALQGFKWLRGSC